MYVEKRPTVYLCGKHRPLPQWSIKLTDGSPLYPLYAIAAGTVWGTYRLFRVQQQQKVMPYVQVPTYNPGTSRADK